MLSIPSQKPFRGMQLNRVHPLARGLTGCWLFNEKTGDKVFDLSGNGNTGTVTAGNWEAGGLNITGTVNIADSNTLIQTDEIFTTVIFYKPTLLGASSRYIVGSASGNSDWSMVSYLQYLYFYLGGSYRSYKESIGINKFNQLVANYDGSYTRIYINGELRDSDTYSGGHTYGGNGMYVGGSNFVGISVLVMIYKNRVLSDEEIKQLYREPYTVFQPAISPGLLYYDAGAPPTGIPVHLHLYNQMRQ